MPETIVKRGPVTRAEIEERSRSDDERDVAAVLNDLVESGLFYVTGRGRNAVYGVASTRDAEVSQREQDRASVPELVWMAIYRAGPITEDALRDEVPVEPAVLASAIVDLANDGRIEHDDARGWRTTHLQPRCGSARCSRVRKM